MASLALGAIGGYFFGPVGFLAGELLGNLLFPQKVDGPRLNDLHLHTSSYGGMIPIVYGTVRAAGVIDWETDLTEHQSTSGGKGGPEVTTFTYSASFGVRLCEGPIAGIGRIWANGRLIYDPINNSITTTLPMTIYLGDELQTADPTMQTVLGAANVPAYRGIARVVFANLLLTDYGNTLPSLNFEIFTKGHTNAAMSVLYENLAEGYTFAGGAIGGARLATDYFPYIQQWPLYSGQVLIGSIQARYPHSPDTDSPGPFAGPVQTYNATPDLNYITQSLTLVSGYPNLIDMPLAAGGFFGDAPYYPIGNYVMSPKLTVALWWSSQGFISQDSLDSPPLASSDVMGYPNDHPIGVNYAHLFGIPNGLYINGASLSADGKRLLLFAGAGPAGAASITNWYEVIAGAITRTGTCSPALDSSVIGFGQQRTFEVGSNCFEQGGQYMWSYTYNDGSHGSGGYVSVYSIDSTLNLKLNATCGFIGIGLNNNGIAGALFSMADGYCGWAGANGLIVFSRLVAGDTLLVKLSDIVSDLSVRAGLTTAQIDVTALTDLVDGYVITGQQSVRTSIDELRQAYFFDAAEVDGKIVFVKRGGSPTVTIPDIDLAAFTEGGTPPAQVGTVRTPVVDLPQLVTLSYIDPGADYQSGTAVAQRQTVSSQTKVSLNLGIVLTAASAQAIVYQQLYMAWLEQQKFTMTVPRKYAQLVPTDVISVQGKSIQVRSKKESLAGVIQLDGVLSLPQILQQSPTPAPGVGFTSSPPKPTSVDPTTLLLLDTPLITDVDDPNGFYAAMSGDGLATWPGAALFKSTDGGTTYTSTVSDTIADVTGVTSTGLGNFFGGNTFDESNTVTVVLVTGTLSSASALAVLNGANEALIGSELVQFKNAVLGATETYTLSGLLRGRRGTEWAMGGHGVGEAFALMPVTRVPSPFTELNLTRQYEGVTFGGTLAATPVKSFANRGASLRCYAPVLLGGGVDASGNVTLNWTRRTRIGGAWLDYQDAALSEATEAYVVQIWNSTYTQCARVITGLSSPTAAYTSAQQVSDFGSQQKTIYFTAGQIGAFGLGTQAKGTAAGAGGSNGNPTTPVSPYQSPTSGSGSPPPAANVISVPIDWARTGINRVYTSSYGAFACSQVVAFKFTTGAISAPGVIGRIGGAEYPGTSGPVARTACLSTTSNDFTGTALGANSLVQNTSPTIFFSVGSNTLGYPALAINTAYYLNVKNDNSLGVCSCMTSDCGMYMDLVKPTGT